MTRERGRGERTARVPAGLRRGVASRQRRRAGDRPASTHASPASIEVLPVQGSVYLLAGGGSNVVVQVGDDAVFVVDTNAAAMSDKMLAAIRDDLEGAHPLHRQHVGRSRSRRRQRRRSRRRRGRP